MKNLKNTILTFSFLISFYSTTQTQYPFKIMAYNVLNLQSSSTDRFPYLKKVIDATLPDLLVLEEVATSAALTAFKNSVLDGTYACGTFIDGEDSDKCICYKINQFKFISNTPIQTSLRDINQFKMVHLATGDTLRVFAVHLKASDSQEDALSRNQEIQQLRAVTDQLTLEQDWIVCGDFNLYRSSEGAYQLLKSPNGSVNGYVIDPINITGEWGVAQYAAYHTQSPRYEEFGGGIAGGLDDRFDLILYSKSIDMPGGLDYVPNSTLPYGNDGQHYNKSINALPTNTAVSQTIADALYYGSDHLPIIAEFVYTVAGIDENELTFGKLSPNPTNGLFTLNSVKSFNEVEIFDLMGKVVSKISFESAINETSINVENLNKGVYYIQVSSLNNEYSLKLIKD
ncbi:MAG: T9SS type A sorting domain-containing protein [Flavobacteriia bacterium]|nr:T9SS type A sorting domain-containing protein [Flavobacteriia bacterium]